MMDKKLKKTLKALAICFISLALFHYLGLLSPVESLLMRALSPLSGRLHGLGSSWREKSDASHRQQDLNGQIEALRKQVDGLTAANAQLQETATENQKLRSYFQFFSGHKFNQKLARAVFQENYLDASRNSQNIMIDRGSHDGLIPGLAVINDSGLLVGKIIEVKESTARVCLLSSSSCKFATAIQNQGRTIGVAEGDLGLAIKMNFIPLNEKINIGDIVVTSGLEKNVPAGLVAGSVNQIDINPNDIWQNITLKPAVNFDNLDIVSVLLP